MGPRGGSAVRRPDGSTSGKRPRTTAYSPGSLVGDAAGSSVVEAGEWPGGAGAIGWTRIFTTAWSPTLTTDDVAWATQTSTAPRSVSIVTLPTGSIDVTRPFTFISSGAPTAISGTGGVMVVWISAGPARAPEAGPPESQPPAPDRTGAALAPVGWA